jgi:hypothetical protein
LAFTISGSTFKYFRNGVLFMQGTNSIGNIEMGYRYNNRIGAAAYNYCPNFCFTGIMDEFRVYS